MKAFLKKYFYIYVYVFWRDFVKSVIQNIKEILVKTQLDFMDFIDEEKLTLGHFYASIYRLHFSNKVLLEAELHCQQFCPMLSPEMIKNMKKLHFLFIFRMLCDTDSSIWLVKYSETQSWVHYLKFQYLSKNWI